jgi:hypothetical protein
MPRPDRSEDEPPRHRLAPGALDGSPPRNQRRTGADGQRAALAWLGRKLAAALAAAGLQDRATRTGAHPQTEAVGLGPAAVVRLEGPLAHGLAPSIRRRPRWLTSALGSVDNTTPAFGCGTGETHRQLKHTGSAAYEQPAHEVSTVRHRPPPRSNRVPQADSSILAIVSWPGALLSCRLEPKRCGPTMGCGPVGRGTSSPLHNLWIIVWMHSGFGAAPAPVVQGEAAAAGTRAERPRE